MALFRKHRSPDPRTERLVEFVGEQDGPVEQQLKATLAAELATRPHVHRAYLAQVRYAPDGPHDVALCIRGAKDQAVVEAAGACFARIFASNVHLDIMFLTDAQEQDVQRVCKSFFSAV
jgi:hypothetical protein